MTSKASIFLSHNSNDKPFAKRLGQELLSAGARVWIDEAEIKLGDSLIQKIGEGIETCDYLGVVLSPDSVGSQWVRKEVEIAMNKEISGKRVFVLPLLYRPCEMPIFLSGKLYADFTTSKKFLPSLNLIKERLGLPLTPLALPPDIATEDLLHQLRSPLTTARRRVSHLLHKTNSSPEVLSEFSKLDALLARSEHIISSFRFLQAYARGQYPMRIERDQSLLKIIVPIVRHFETSSRDRLRIHLEHTIDPHASIDSRLIEVAVWNLLDNAVKYSYPDSTINVSCAGEGSLARITVTNRGVPIGDEEEAHIFQKGYRSRVAQSVSAQGAGMGLFLTQQIMMSHGGSVRYRMLSQPDIHEFSLEWPKQYSPEAA